MSGGAKKVVAVAAAIAVPFVAPAVSAAIGLSGAIGATAGSAVTGAVLGGATAAATGGDVGRGALLGGIGGGISGYSSTLAAPTAQPAPQVTDLSTPAVATSPTVTTGLGTPTGAVNGIPTYDLSTGVSTGLTSAPATTTGGFNLFEGGTMLQPGTAPAFSAAPTSTFADLPLSQSIGEALANPTVGGQSLLAPTAAAPPVGTGTVLSPQAPAAPTAPPAGLNTGSAPAVSAPVTPTAPTTAPVAPPTTFVEALQRVPDAVANRFRDPNALADLTLRAAGQLAGSYFAEDLSPEEEALLDAQRQELEYLQENNQELFQERIDQARQLIGDAKYFDPEYFGLQAARGVQQRGAIAREEALRGIDPRRAGLRAAEARRANLATSRDVGTAFDQGLMRGVEGRNQMTAAGLTALPSQAPATALGSYGQNLMSSYISGDERRTDRASGISKLFDFRDPMTTGTDRGSLFG
jgi:hypothetical protein